MARTVRVRKRNVKSIPRVKTGCATCRIRKVKCDENRPFCRRCVSTGRTCDGYSSPFRHYNNQCIDEPRIGKTVTDVNQLSMNSNSTEIGHEEIDLLSRYFSTKTIFNVKLGCDEEAKQLLQASLTDPTIQHAILSLRALRKDYETSGRVCWSAEQQKSSYSYGLEQYSMALTGLASNLLSPDSRGLKSALLCCQIFISIEQVQGNYAAMAQHIIRGLRIMHECRARPCFTATGGLVPTNHDQLPLLDVFVIKVFAAPCKFTDSPTVLNPNETTVPCQNSGGSQSLRTIVPDTRVELQKIAASTLDFLDTASRVESAENARRLLFEKAALLKSLESWLTNLERMQIETESPETELISVSFMRILYLILKIVLLGAIESSPDVEAELRIENDQLQSVANSLDNRLKQPVTGLQSKVIEKGNSM